MTYAERAAQAEQKSSIEALYGHYKDRRSDFGGSPRRIGPGPGPRTDEEITDEEAVALARATVNLFDRWELEDLEACALLGNMDMSVYRTWKNGSIGRIDLDILERMAILIGIHKALRHIFTEPGRCYEWIRKPNDAFQGRCALDVLKRGELVELRDYLYAEAVA